MSVMTCKVASNPVRKALHTTHNYPSIYFPGEAKPLREVGEYIKDNAAGGAIAGGRSYGEGAQLVLAAQHGAAAGNTAVGHE